MLFVVKMDGNGSASLGSPADRDFVVEVPADPFGQVVEQFGQFFFRGLDGMAVPGKRLHFLFELPHRPVAPDDAFAKLPLLSGRFNAQQNLGVTV